MADRLLLESGDLHLLETGDERLQEDGTITIGNYFGPTYFPPTFNESYTGAAAVSTRTADIWFYLNLAKFPATEGTTTYRWGYQPLADTGSFKEGRLISISTIKRAATDADGNYSIGGFTATVSDDDNAIRTLLEQGMVTEYFLNREGGVELLSPAGRAAGLTPRTLSRGWVRNVQTLANHTVSIEIADVVGSQFCGFNLDKTIPSVKLQDISPTVIDSLKERVLPIYIGTFSDAGALDVNGETAEKGLVPAFDLGIVDATDTSATPVEVYSAPPAITSSVVVGTGDQTYTYSATLVTPYGESRLGNVVTVSGAPSTATMGLSNYVALSGTYDPGTAGTNIVRIIGRNGTTTWLDDAFTDGVGTWAYNDGAHPAPTPTRADVDIPKAFAVPSVSGALASDTIWHIMGVCLGYNYDILDVFGSDLADDTEPKRTKLGASVHGVEILTPDDAGWPYPNPWIEKNGITFTGFLARGQRLLQHQNGAVTFAVDLCGPHDADGKVINQAFLQLPLLINEHVAKNGGTGYRTGAYWPLESYANGDPLLKTSAFLAAQAITAGWLGDAFGYIGAIAITEPTTVREIVQRFCQTFGCRLAHDHHGQVFPVIVSASDDPTAGRLLRDKIEIRDIGDPILAHDEVINRIVYDYFFDPDANAFRNTSLPLENTTSIAAHTPGGVVGGTDRRGVKPDTRKMYYCSDEATATDVVTRELVRRARRPRYVPTVLDYMGLELEIGADVRITHHDGLGAGGDVAMRGVVLEHETDTDRDEVTLLVQDLRTLDA